MNPEQQAKRNAYHRHWHVTHPESTKRAYRKWYLKARKERYEYLAKVKSMPCMDCGKQYHPVCMDFDHRDRTTKVNSISKLSWDSRSLERIKEEIKKCDLVCANCHRLRTYKQFNMDIYK